MSKGSPTARARREFLAAGTGVGALTLSSIGTALPAKATHPRKTKESTAMNFISTQDGVNIFYKDWGPRDAQPLVFHHGWPLTADEWDNQLFFFLQMGFRVIAHDRRGHGRSTQTDDGNEMDTYAADVAALVEALELRGAVHIGHSTGAGEATHYAARAKPGRLSKLAIIAGVPPIMVKTEANPGGLPIAVFDGFRSALAANRSQFYFDIASGPFYGFNRPGATVNQGLVQNWWRQGMIGSAKAHYDCIKAFSETDFSEDLKAIGVPTLVMHGDDDQVVPYSHAAPLSAKLLRKATLKTYKGLPHGMCATNADVVNTDLLAFIRSDS